MAKRKGKSHKGAQSFALYFDTTSAAADYCRTHEPLQVWKDSYDSIVFSSASENEKFFQLPSLEDAFRLLADGDKESAAKIRAAGELLSDNIGGVPAFVDAVVGCVPNVPNYLKGLPKAMFKVQREPRGVPVIDLYVYVSIAHSKKAEDMARAGLTIANAVTAIELSGVRVNLYALCAAYDAKSEESQNYTATVKIKDSTEPLNLLNIAFPLVHPAFFRACYLYMMETKAEVPQAGHYWCMSASRARSVCALVDGVMIDQTDIIENKRDEQYIADIVNAYLQRER